VMLGVLGIASWALYHAIERLVGNAGSRPFPARQQAVPHAR
jgi:hypothetical protein